MRTNDAVVAGCDPHKRTMTVGIVDVTGATVDARSFPNTPVGLAAVVSWLAGLTRWWSGWVSKARPGGDGISRWR